ncbi:MULTISPECIES: CoA-binding protein [unclassified Kutzneria]|uniref:CoA-binding protein n=1 Tax=unclassified Kutzneria TaxID=2621979 RepID=UPI0005BE285D|nr:CoA-binding protein [Kutzneria sp. 744]
MLTSARTIAVVGLSTQPWKAAHSVPASLKAAGYKVIPVHPTATEILGEKAYRSLLDIPEHIDIVDVFRPADETPAIAEQAVQVKAGALWLQLGIANDQARAIAEAAGLPYVEDRCIAVERSTLGL